MSPALSLEGILTAMACLCSSTDNGGNNFYSSLGNQINMRYPNESIGILRQNDVTEINGRLFQIEMNLRSLQGNEETRENRFHNRLNQLENTLTTTHSTQEIRLNQLESTLAETLTQIHYKFNLFESFLTGLKTMQVTTPSPIELRIYECPTNVKKSEITIRTLIPTRAICEEVKGGQWLVVYTYNIPLNQDYNPFNQPWSLYQKGSGIPDSNFIIGLDNLHQLTNSRPHKLLIEVEDSTGAIFYGHYDHFLIGDANEDYILKNIGDYFGEALFDYFTNSKGFKFSTYDRDNDNVKDVNCAATYNAWWHGNNCVRWLGTFSQPIKKLRVMIRPKD